VPAPTALKPVSVPAAGPIAPTPVVDIRAPEDARPPSPDGVRICTRCRGTCEAGTQFCKFCGAPFGDARPGSAFPRPAPQPAGRSLPLPPPPIAPTGPTSPGQPSAAPQIVAPHANPFAGVGPNAATTAGHPSGPQPDAPAFDPEVGDAPAGATPLLPPSNEPSQYRGSPGLLHGKPAGRLVVITKDGGEGASYPIYEQIDVGRSEGDVVVHEDRYLSPRHARVLRRLGAAGEVQLVLRDLQSANGIFLRIGHASISAGGGGGSGGEGRAEAVLHDQDLFLVGQQVLKFQIVKDAEEGLGPATHHGTLLFGTPQAPRFARLSLHTVEGVARDVFYLRRAETVLGRESGDIVFTDDPFLSRRHAIIQYDRENKRFLLADLGSSNGTFLQIRGDVALQDSDQFRVGQQLFRVELNRAGI
jgi:pSer/pThr/pTyr-binding forkhead associated (FHA) protein